MSYFAALLIFFWLWTLALLGRRLRELEELKRRHALMLSALADTKSLFDEALAENARLINLMERRDRA